MAITTYPIKIEVKVKGIENLNQVIEDLRKLQEKHSNIDITVKVK